MANVEAVKPCLRAFCDERALPSGVRGPVECLALEQLAARCFSEMGLLKSDNGNTSRPSGSTRAGWSLKLGAGKRRRSKRLGGGSDGERVRLR